MSVGKVTNPAQLPATPSSGIYDAVTPTLNDGDQTALQLDSSGNLKVNVITGGGGGSNASVGPTGTTAPTSATEVGIIVGGNLVGVSSSNPVPVSGTVTASNPSVGTDGSAAPTSSTQIGGSDGTNLQPLQVDSSKNLKIAGNVNQTLGTPGFEAITDGTNGPAAVKAASTAAVAADKSLVVAVSPNTPVATLASGLAESTASWTSATSVNTALQVNLNGNYGTVTVALSVGSSVTGGFVTFEVSDTTAFTNAYLISGISINTVAAIQNNYQLSSQSPGNIPWSFNVAGWAAFRVRLSTATTGAGTVGVGITSAAGGPSTYIVQSSGLSIKSTSSSSAIPDNTTVVNYLEGPDQVRGGLLTSETLYGGAFSGTADTNRQGWSKSRVPTVFKTVQATASGNTAIWTPGSGNKFRLLGVFVQLTDNASLAAGAVFTISFQDGTTAMPIAFDVFVPTTAVTSAVGDGLEQSLSLGAFGIQSATANNVLNVNLSTVLATGNVRVIVMGTEE